MLPPELVDGAGVGVVEEPGAVERFNLHPPQRGVEVGDDLQARDGGNSWQERMGQIGAGDHNLHLCLGTARECGDDDGSSGGHGPWAVEREAAGGRKVQRQFLAVTMADRDDAKRGGRGLWWCRPLFRDIWPKLVLVIGRVVV
ncbi:MAG TPA: hypothetical protein VGA47_00900 [Candidatus Dormibacteraeota bacterium]